MKFKDFDIFSWTKPYAKTEEILKDCYNIEDSNNNYFILCVGENDTNVTKIFFETAAVIKILKYSNFIILNTNYNKYLNKYKLNNMLKNLCNNMPNCNFIECTNRSRTEYHAYICAKINLMLDSKYYENHFIKNIKTIIKNRSNVSDKMHIMGKSQGIITLSYESKTAEPKIGTIPYYFKKVNKLNKTLTVENSRSLNMSTTQFFRTQ
ncbi:unnamed protein product [Parnassius mnemosyne]|uniref:Uncharacterized protein n=1 Tax=Parnassius mnemosyne TaxID=213953 RepID=A0AAV1KLU2_9NEOP